MDKKTQLRKLLDDIKEFEFPKRRAQGPKLVFGNGSIDAEIMFIGEAPGANEAIQGKPFVGRAGQLLDKLLVDIGIDRMQVYVTNLIKFRPPENRDPTPQEVIEYTPFLTRHIDIIHPKIIITLGRFSMNYFLPDAKITRDHGQLHKSQDYTIYPVFHPAAALRDPSRMKELEADFKKLPHILAEMRKKSDNG